MSTGTPSGGLRGEDLRSLVREVLRESLDSLPGPLGTVGPVGAAEPVALRADADLDAFVRRLARECEDPLRRADLREGRVRFRHAAAPLAPTPDTAGQGQAGDQPAVPVQRVERGALTERHVRDAARAGARLVAAAGTVITPLAQDRARAMGVDIEKER